MLRSLELVFLLIPVLLNTASAKTSEATSTKSFHDQAVEAVEWGMPIVAMDAMRQAYIRDAKAHYNDLVYLSKGWKNQITTPNSSSNYLYFNYNLKDEPLIVEIPAAEGGGVFGSFNDAWQAPLADVGPKGTDEGKGGKYLIIPPNFKGHLPRGYIHVKSDTINGYAILRLIPQSTSDEDMRKVWGLADKVKVYPLSKDGAPYRQQVIDMRDKVFDGIAQMDETFFDRLSLMINEEPVLTRDQAFMKKLKALGLEKGKPFDTAAHKADLKAAVDDVHVFLKTQLVDQIESWSGKANWGMMTAGLIGAKTGFAFKSGNGVDIKSRAAVFYVACAPPKKLGDASIYLQATKDNDKQVLKGENSYKLRVPANVPVDQFWAVNVYDIDTAAFFRDSPAVGHDSYDNKVAKNPDGTVDIYFGPKAPQGQEKNWIYTAPGKQWFALFRFYGPKDAVKNKTWQLPDIEKITIVRQAAK